MYKNFQAVEFRVTVQPLPLISSLFSHRYSPALSVYHIDSLKVVLEYSSTVSFKSCILIKKISITQKLFSKVLFPIKNSFFKSYVL